MQMLTLHFVKVRKGVPYLWKLLSKRSFRDPACFHLMIVQLLVLVLALRVRIQLEGERRNRADICICFDCLSQEVMQVTVVHILPVKSCMGPPLGSKGN